MPLRCVSPLRYSRALARWILSGRALYCGDTVWVKVRGKWCRSWVEYDLEKCCWELHCLDGSPAWIRLRGRMRVRWADEVDARAHAGRIMRLV